MVCTARLMRAEDIAQVSEIDHEAFPTDWHPNSFKRELNSKLVRHLVAYEESAGAGGSCYHAESTGTEAKGRGCWLACRVKRLFRGEHTVENEKGTQTDQNIVGYATIWLMLDEAHLTSIAVRETHRKRGIGELLLISAINLAIELNAQVATLEVRSSNSTAQALYEKYGFAKVGIRRAYYADNGEDAVVMTTERITSASYQAKFKQLKEAYKQRWETNQLPYPLARPAG
jgi:ribosomal-protein-alanine N-acetyltransferase